MHLPILIAWLRANWGKMALGAAFCALVAFPVALIQPKSYKSTATLIVFPPTFKDARPTTVTGDEVAGIAEMMPRALPVEAYKAIALSPALVRQVIDELELKDTGIQALRNRLEVELVQRGSRSVQTGVMYTPTILFHARADEPETAARIAQTWASVFKDNVDRLSKQGVSETFTLLDSLHGKTRSALEDSELLLAQHSKAWNLPLMQAELDAKQKQLTELEALQKQTDIDLASGETRLASLRGELVKETKKEVYFRAPSDDAYWSVALDGGKPKLEPDTGLRTEEPNPAYAETRAAEVEANATVEGLKAQKETILVKVGELKDEIQALSASIADKTVERDRLTRENDSLKDSYTIVRKEFEMGRMAEQTQASDIVISGEAAVPIDPTSPRSATLVVAVAFAGALVTGGFLFLKDLSQMPLTAERQSVWFALAEASGDPRVLKALASSVPVASAASSQDRPKST